MNTTSSNDKMKDDELRKSINTDLTERGSPKRRYGMKKQITSPVSGKGQGYFRYFEDSGNFQEIEAINGKLYKDGLEIPINGLTSFQATRPVEAAQFENSLFIATGTKIVEYDGTNAKVIEPYKPNTLDVLYVGTNTLSPDPDNYITDSESTYLRLEGVTVDKKKGITNTKSLFTAYVAKPPESTIEFKYQYRKKGESTWNTGHDYSLDKTFEFAPRETGFYEIMAYARVQGTVEEVQYIIPYYEVKELDENEKEKPSTIHNCNRVILYWDRLIMYGDRDNDNYMYVSHINNPRYFPKNNSLEFESTQNEPVTCILQFRNLLIGFTPNSVQAVYGKHPGEFQRHMINTDVGCIAPYGACVTENTVTFLSKEGVYSLQSLEYSQDRMNVARLDTKVSDMVYFDEDACTFSYDKQFHLVYPSKNVRLRYYYERGAWTMDQSPKLDFTRMYEWNNKLFGISSSNGNVMVFDKEIFNDDGHLYEMEIETKSFNLGDDYRKKKLKELELLVAHFENAVGFYVYVYADSTVVMDPEKRYVEVDETGSISWRIDNSPNIHIDAGTVFGSWKMGESSWGNVESSVKKIRVSGRCRNVRLRILHKEDFESQLNGIGFTYVVGTI